FPLRGAVVSTRAGVLSGLLSAPDVLERTSEVLPASSLEPWSPEDYEREQLRSLVRQVFFPGWPRPARQVVLSTMDEGIETASAGLRIGKVMAGEISGNVGVIEIFPL